MTAETPVEQVEPGYRGAVIIDWPQPRVEGVPPVFAEVLVTDAATGKPISTCTALAVRVSSGEPWITADLTMLVTEAGEPLLDIRSEVMGKDCRPLVGTFPFLVTEMRVSDVWQRGRTAPEGRPQ